MSRANKEPQESVQSVLFNEPPVEPKIERIRCYQTVELRGSATTGFNAKEFSIEVHPVLPGFLVKKLNDKTDVGTVVFFSNCAYARFQ